MVNIRGKGLGHLTRHRPQTNLDQGCDVMSNEHDKQIPKVKWKRGLLSLGVMLCCSTPLFSVLVASEHGETQQQINECNEHIKAALSSRSRPAKNRLFRASGLR